ncbi:MAG: acyl-CoA thioesterase domain-containing protein [Acidimicrobiales bacterium]
MKISRYPLRARAFWGQAMVAQSDSCLCVEEEGEPATLYFPPDDIRVELFRDEVRRISCPVRGEVELLSIDPPPESGGPLLSASTASWDAPDAIGSDGREVLWRISRPSERLHRLSGYGAFDPVRMRVEVVDGRPEDQDRDVTVKRFPTWGDAAHLIELLDVQRDDDRSFVGVARSDGRRPVVEGSQMLGQAIVAAGRHAPGRRVVSANMIFLRPGDARLPLRFELGELSAGRTFSTLTVQVLQDGRCCAAGTLLLDVTSPDAIRHAVEPPPVPGPYDSPAYDMGVTGRDVRIVEAAYTNAPHAPVGPPVLDAWVRFRALPEDPPLHAGLLAQFTGHLSIAAALRPHPGIGQDQAHRSLSTAINGISLSMHRAVRADRWMLYHHLSTFAGDGMTHSECRVHTEGGELLASFSVEAMVRPFANGATTLDERTAL